MNHKDIRTEKLKLDRERRQKLEKFLDEYDGKFYDPELKKLQENCEKLGHNFVFTNFGPVGDAFYHCEHCGKTKFENR